MAKLAQSTIKYLIEASFSANGIVEKPDVIGAVFGQTEGLLGQDLDLRELQRTGRIGRIEVRLNTDKNTTTGTIVIPSSLDSSETALIAAAIETIERIGPCDSKIELKAIKDIRMVKRDYVVDRAKEILKKLLEEAPETDVLTERIKESVRTSEIGVYKNLECGPDVLDSDEIIVVEGRADVMNLLKNGIKNAVAVGGITIPPQLVDLCGDKKRVIAFLDGDRGGDLILKELLHLIRVDEIARAPDGKEVEELTKKEIYKALRSTAPLKTTRAERKKELDSKTREKAASILDKMVGTRAAYIFDDKMKMVGKIPLNQFNENNRALKDARIVLVDDVITPELVEVAEAQNIGYLIADSAERKFRTKTPMVYTKPELTG